MLKISIRKKTVVFILAVVILISLAVLAYFYYSAKVNSQESDFSKLSWTGAFERLNERISKEYAFTEWKRIDWQSLYEEYRPKIEAAQLASDFESYYISLLAYLNEIPDGHVRMGNVKEIDDKHIGGCYGLAVAKLDEGKVIITWVDESGPAYAAGVRAGAELLQWNGKPIKDSIEAVSTLFAGPSATNEVLEWKKLRHLVRAPIGKEISISFLNMENTAPQSVLLTAYSDNRKSFKKSYPDSVISDILRDMILGVDNPDPMPESMIEKKVFNGNISYIKIWGEFDADLQMTGKTPSTIDQLRLAVKEANEQKSKGLIIDLRNNLGGLDSMAADILGSFYSVKTLYEYQNIYDMAKGEREILPADNKGGSLALYIEPAQQYFGGKVIALVNQKCVSSGEGIAMGIKNLPNGETLGFYGTNGSFGLSGAKANMSGGLTVDWPSGQSLDENKNIQLGSKDGIGGVSPSIRIPMTAENAMRIAKGEDVELEEAIRILSSID